MFKVEFIRSLIILKFEEGVASKIETISVIPNFSIIFPLLFFHYFNLFPLQFLLQRCKPNRDVFHESTVIKNAIPS